MDATDRDKSALISYPTSKKGVDNPTIMFESDKADINDIYVDQVTKKI